MITFSRARDADDTEPTDSLDVLARIPILPVTGVFAVLFLGSGWTPASGGVTPDRLVAIAALALPRADEGALEVTVLDAETGEPMPARVRVLGASTTPDPRLGPDHRARGALDTIVTSSGFARTALPAGRYEVVASRGPEHTIERSTVAISARETARIVLALERVVESGEWVACDFHLHAEASPDSDVSLADRIASLAAEGVGFAVPTEHNRVVDYAPTARALGLDGFGTVPGVEVTTWAPEYGHFNVFPWRHDPSAPRGGAPEFRGTQPAELLETLHGAGADVVVQVNHPRLEDGVGYFDHLGLDPSRPGAMRAAELDFDAIEVWNGYDLDRPSQVERNLEEWMTLLTHGVRATATGNSDSHRIHGQWAGYPRTYVRVPGGRTDDGAPVVRALRAGAAFVTNGPLLELEIEGAGPGATARSHDGHVRADVRVRAPAWMDVSRLELWVGGQLAHREALSPTVRHRAREARISVDLRVPAGSFVIAVVRGDAPMDALLAPRRTEPFAFTNPVWVD